ncbi:MAG: CaiB/BaiF CoA transferase family protein [Acidimicrobiales bacterium]|jgi:formyl-CoA transferase/succinyl-CoA--D-citramalate CoA-transferase
MAAHSGPLAGLRVLELGSFIAGPFAGQLLGDYGAEVVKIEPPVVGDPMRKWGHCDPDGHSYWWPSIARNKKSVAVDLRSDEGRSLIRRLALNSDIVLENFVPGRLAQWSLGYADLVGEHPGLIMTHVSGFGQTGPRATDPGFGSIGEAMGGIRHTTGWPDRQSTRAGISLGDALASLFAVVGTLAAVSERHVSGRGQEVDVAIYEAVFALMESTVADFERAGHTRGRSGSVLPGVAPSNVYPTKDGYDVMIAANADQIYARLCLAMGQPNLATDPRFATHVERGARQTELDDLIVDWSGSLSIDELEVALDEHSIPYGRIFTAPDMLADPQFAARQMISRFEDEVLGGEVPMASPVPKFSRTPANIIAVGPKLGEHTDWALTEVAGCTSAEITGLRAANVVE